MKKIVDDERMMLRVCDLYYNRDVSQSDIAKLMGISRPTVAKLLQSAKQKEIVKIIICDPQESDPKAVRIVESMYDALNMRIVSMNSSSHDVHTAYVSHV